MRALRRIWSYWPGAVLVLGVLLFLFVIARSSSFQACYARHEQYTTFRDRQEKNALGFSWIVRNAKVAGKCAGEFAEHNHGPLTAVATILLALFTTTLWWATRRLLVHATHIERAYVFGGCGGQTPLVDPLTTLPVAMRVQATHGNYGKTPAFVERIFVEQCHQLPPRPIYEHPFVVNDALLPGIMGRPINNVFHTVSAADGPIYYGRIHYRDIFEKAHFSSFVYRFSANGQRHEPMGDVDPAYWEFN